MIQADNLMKSSLDWDWVDQYAAQMGDLALVEYSRKLFNYLHALPDDSEVNIESIVKPETADLFAKCVCRFHYEGRLNLQFSPDFSKLRKYNNEPEQWQKPQTSKKTEQYSRSYQASE